METATPSTPRSGVGAEPALGDLESSDAEAVGGLSPSNFTAEHDLSPREKQHISKKVGAKQALSAFREAAGKRGTSASGSLRTPVKTEQTSTGNEAVSPVFALDDLSGRRQFSLTGS